MSALVLLATGFEEIEGVTVIDILRRAEIETVVAGLTPNPITASRHTHHVADVLLSDIAPSRQFEIVVLPGGAAGAYNLGESPLVKEWLDRQRERDQWVAAICAGPTALKTQGWLLPDQRLICHPSVQDQFQPKHLDTAQRVVVDGKLITGLAAGAALEFAFEIVRCLRGTDAVAKVNHGVCALFRKS